MTATIPQFGPSAEVSEIRQRVGHQIVDADGHLAEFAPWVYDLVRDIGGADVERRLQTLSFASAEPGSGAMPVRTFHSVPSRNTLDRMTTLLPELHYRRLDEFGIDYALLYPSYGLLALGAGDPELRRVAARALNTYAAQAYEGLRDRLEPVAVIPCFTPQEAVDELEHAVGTLGLKAVVMTGVVPRSVRPDGTRVPWTDTLGHDSAYDYDPVWEACQRLGVTPAFHGIGYGWGSRISPTNYVYNHLGSFAAAQEAVCRSLVMGGVPQRFPGLHFSFLEGGVSWACQLFADLISHFEKRNRDAVAQFDPKEFDLDLGVQLLDTHGREEMRARRDAFAAGMRAFMERDEPDIDDFAESGLAEVDDIVTLFTERFTFGCEADDPLTRLAFDRVGVTAERPLRAAFASDIGHWDVPDAREVLLEAYELVEDGVVDHAAFRAFTCDNALHAMTATNPAFFDGTAVEAAAREIVARRSA